MLMETGVFGAALLPDGSFSESFAARVVIPDTEFAALGLGEHEAPTQLPACFRWCFDKLGPGGQSWAPELADPATAIVYFKRLRDAIDFVACWNSVRTERLPAAA
jgi:hypothetical protein